MNGRDKQKQFDEQLMKEASIRFLQINRRNLFAAYFYLYEKSRYNVVKNKNQWKVKVSEEMRHKSNIQDESQIYVAQT